MCIRKLTQLIDKQNVDVLEESWNLMNRILNEPKDLFAVAPVFFKTCVYWSENNL